MVSNIFKKIFGSRNERLIKHMSKMVSQINRLEADIEKLSDGTLKEKTGEFRSRLEAGETLDSLMYEAFAVVREVGRRVMQMHHFDVQLIGGMVLHHGKIAEMRTGEGKTLVATLAAYLNALPAKGVHVVTVNDYLARRDAAWMGRIYDYLGLTTGVINSSGDTGPDSSSYLYDPEYDGKASGYLYMRPVDRQQVYAADITYGTNNEYGFDYLRDNMAFSAEQRVQRPPFFAIVDEVDSILIDEARTPLIISGPTDDSSDLYKAVDKIIPRLSRQSPITNEEGKPDFGPGDFSVDEKARQVYFSEEGHQHVEEMLTEAGLLEVGTSLYDSANIILMHHANAALRAHVLFQRNVEYIVKDAQIVIVDEFTGRTMLSRRWSDGQHQAVEAKEGVEIQNENQTLASITFQNYFRLYKKLSGMTGTADTEAFEFQQIYGLEVVVIPTNQSMIRKDMGDLVYLTPEEKFQAILEDVQDCVKRGQPALVGTGSIEISELVSELLQKADVDHKVLNAKHHEQEAGIVAQAGRPGAITIATNMAGRGTDIVLGGNLKTELEDMGENLDPAVVAEHKEDWKKRHQHVLDAGGLHVIGTERHESRRIDNQLRGRSGRQGDPGSSRFYLSLQDNLMRIFASDKVSGLMQKLGMEKGEAIEHPWVSKAIENAQRKVEGRNFDIRKQLLEYDDVANDQRKVVYEQRNELMETSDISNSVTALREDVLNDVFHNHIPRESIEEQWDVPNLSESMAELFGGEWPIQQWLDDDGDLHEETLKQKIDQTLLDAYQEKEQLVGEENMRQFEKAMMLQAVDSHWKEHLAAMDYLRQGIHLRGYAQKNPKQEYKREAFEMFSNMLDSIKQEVTGLLSKVRVQMPEEMALQELQPQVNEFEFKHETFEGLSDETAPVSDQADQEPEQHQPFVRDGRKIGRNEPCPCGSGKKYKQCHGRLS
ncbi:MAG: preprotein translocase subunit SecA [Candidatus Thiodiazotropha sp. (ex Lucinoma aequizonata)]|nr:preprotein translocase subunit SecA [Candidatus Thiodiazotropha sp. (ex Lucinoma aequizonata)]MCU7886853.1 preprotein translocase subunit SecA [Candidatus Thiodiazotropha sp. (ex Lucinoma aequizonata)]MCU7896121.1 preprotein translocase subunit SecA [Candidatus Thiodiazotropha sp. (ex Lucinoma aequizonata)]MCU7900286.1 preprotein translocase subunit SecA [Candidatus Thiodiazotropha sp. (ex Lucinoma aequizonata)]MCU7902428.1 preprotein translocase subunit SecA [Candidatus Thiodiazotropha sp. 